mgnify:CR=1 FL=1
MAEKGKVDEHWDKIFRGELVELGPCFAPEYVWPETLKPRLHMQFLCDKFYLFGSVSPVYMSNFYLKTKDWRLGSTYNIKNCQFYMMYILLG